MAPPYSSRRLKQTALYRPFIYGTTSKLFDPVNNPRPEHVDPSHTHSWTVFVKGVDDVDITYWLRKVQFKLHESIEKPLRTVEAEYGKPFEVHETGWGEFEISIKLYYDPLSQEKPQSLYHHLRLHPYGESDADKEKMRQQDEIISVSYEEQVFGEPYEAFWELLTGGVAAGARAKGRKGEKDRKWGEKDRDREQGERTALIPLGMRPGLFFSRESERAELARLEGAKERVVSMRGEIEEEVRGKEDELRSLKEGLVC